MKYALSAAVALALGIGLAAGAQAHGTVNRQSAVPGADMQAGASAPTRHIAATRNHSRAQVMHTQRMLKAQGLYNGRIDGVMNRRTQMALTRFHHQPKATHRVAALKHQKGMNRIAALHKARKPAGQEIGVGSSRSNNRNAMSGSTTSNITPTPATPPATQAPNAGSNDQKH
jgi:hypothetical protein